MLIDGKTYGLKFGLYALEQLADIYQIETMSELDAKLRDLKIKDLFTFVYVLTENWCIAEEIQPPTPEAVRMAMYKDFQGIFAEVSLVTGATVSDDETEARDVDPSSGN